MTVAGFDPGLRRTGFGILKNLENPSVAGFGVIAPNPRQIFSKRLSNIYFNARRLLEEYRPDIVAVEEVYFAKNPQTTLNLGVVRGLLFAAALEQKIEIASFSPAEVKMAVTGRGNATKEQVQYLVAAELGLKGKIEEDSADALAVCLCYLKNLKYEMHLKKAVV